MQRRPLRRRPTVDERLTKQIRHREKTIAAREQRVVETRARSLQRPRQVETVKDGDEPTGQESEIAEPLCLRAERPEVRDHDIEIVEVGPSESLVQSSQRDGIASAARVETACEKSRPTTHTPETSRQLGQSSQATSRNVAIPSATEKVVTVDDVGVGTVVSRFAGENRDVTTAIEKSGDLIDDKRLGQDGKSSEPERDASSRTCPRRR